MLVAMIQKAYIAYDWIAKKCWLYSKEKLCNIEITKDTLKCFNFERIFEADLYFKGQACLIDNRTLDGRIIREKS